MRGMATVASAWIAAAAALAAAGPAAAGETFDAVKQRGEIRCGVTQGLPGFSNPDDAGRWSGLDVDYCRALAAAALGEAGKVGFVPLSSKQRFTALQSGEVDVLARVTTWTQSRDTALGLHFVGVNYYDGQGFMVRRSLGVTSARQLSGAAVCMNAGTTTELNAADYFRTRGMTYTPVVFERSDEVLAAYVAGRCDVYTTDQSGLYAQRLKLANAADHIVLPEVISKEPLGPAVRQGDDQWFNLARWTLFAMIDAEELGVTKANLAEMRNSKNPAIRRLLGLEGSAGANMGVAPGWAGKIIAAVGNYGESFMRNLGSDSPLGIARGLNRLWTQGGLMYAPPIR